jgi:hypothetical protein
MKRTDLCIECGAVREHQFHRCAKCNAQWFAAMHVAAHAVRKAIRRGDLPKANTKDCTDCDKPAFDWDHRDYRKPLVVEPVCRACNQKRGPALWRTESESKAAA